MDLSFIFNLHTHARTHILRIFTEDSYQSFHFQLGVDVDRMRQDASPRSGQIEQFL